MAHDASGPAGLQAGVDAGGGGPDSDPASRAAPLPVRIENVGRGRLLIVPLGQPHHVLSWAIVNGGFRRAGHVVWREVDLTELGPTVDARAVLMDSLAAVKLPDAVGLLTARDVRRYEDQVAVRGGVRARAVATVGLGNALAAGDPPTPQAAAGTINVLCQLSVPLTEAAFVEACAVAVEARTAAMGEAGLLSPLTGRPATGTGTDCVVIAAPISSSSSSSSSSSPAHEFAGKHTACGSAVGASVREAVSRGISCWLRENEQRRR